MPAVRAQLRPSIQTTNLSKYGCIQRIHRAFSAAISLILWVAACNKLHHHWDFGSASCAGVVGGLTVGSLLYFGLRARIFNESRARTFNISIENAARAIREALVRPIKALGNISSWEEDASSTESRPDGGGVQVLTFTAFIDDIDTEFRRQRISGNVGQITTRVSLSVYLTASGDGTVTIVEVYLHSVQGISSGMHALVLRDARSTIYQTLASY